MASSSNARSESTRPAPREGLALFTISKSENKNEVVYAVELDAQCAPVGASPVHAFWRMHEKGVGVVEPLLSHEEAAYGILRQRTLSAGAAGGKIEMTLRALPSRPIVVETKPGNTHCESWSSIAIAGEQAYLYNVYLKLKTFGVDYLLLSGWALDRSRVVSERLFP